MSFGIEDYVVNEGEITYTTSYQTSINYYRIWNDGFAEVWSRGTRTGVPITSSYGNLYIGSFSWEIPFYFGDTEKVFSHISRCQYDTGASWGQTLDNGSGYINVRIYDNYSRNGDYPIKVSLYASGMFGSWR